MRPPAKHYKQLGVIIGRLSNGESGTYKVVNCELN